MAEPCTRWDIEEPVERGTVRQDDVPGFDPEQR
jgi:hypothetical protein